MSTLVDRFNEFRGSRPAQAISAAMFLALGVYLLLTNADLLPQLGGGLAVILGLLAVYKLLVGVSVWQSLSSLR